MSRRFKIKIMGMSWTVKLFSEIGFLKKHPTHDDCDALALCQDREIHFKAGSATLPVVRHEVRHAFTSELCIESASLTAEQMEEIQCSLDEYRYNEMADISRRIFRKLKTIQNQ